MLYIVRYNNVASIVASMPTTIITMQFYTSKPFLSLALFYYYLLKY